MANSSRNANTDMAGSEMGTPPHTDCRNIDEYALIMVVWQPDAPTSVWPSPGMNEQWMPCSCRSRCWAKS